MPSILESLTSVLGQGDTFAKLGSLMDGDAEQAAVGVAAAGPALLGALAENAGTDEGAQPVADLVDSVGPSILDDVDGFLDGEETELGDSVLDVLFGNDRRELLSGLSSNGTVESTGYTDLLPRLAPLVLGAVAKRKADDDLDAASLAAVLGEEKSALEKDGNLGDWFGRTLAGGGAIAGFAGLAAMARDRLGEAAGMVGDVAGGAADLAGEAAEAVGDAVEDAAEKVGDLAGGVVGKIGDAIGSITSRNGDDDNDDDDDDDDAEVAGAAAAAVAGGSTTAQGLVDSGSDAADDASGSAADYTDSAAAGAVATPDLADAGPDDDDDDDDRRRGIGWFWWAAGALVLVLILAALLTQFGNSDEADDTSVVADGSSSADADDAGDSDDPGDTEGDGADGDGAGSDTELAAAVQAALADAGFADSVSVSVVDGVVMLSGAVGSAADVETVEAAVSSVDGAGQVVNDVQIEAAPVVTAGTSLNEELDLAPITFEYRSATITTGGEAVLAEVVGYLEANAVDLTIEGHTDSDGTEAENQALGQRRADSVKAFLEGAGIDGARLDSVGIGETEPTVANDTVEDKATNRRIELIVAG